MKKTFLLSCLMLAAMPVMAAYTGRVYVDKNKNGVFDPGEKTWAGIKVSDGLNVVETEMYCTELFLSTVRARTTSRRRWTACIR